MLAFVRINSSSNSPELMIGMLALIGLAGGGIWALTRWSLSGPTSPDPWDRQVGLDLEKEETLPLCHRCLSPHNPDVDFCSECGAAVGQYTNWLPFPYLFSVGHTLRIGTAGEFKRSPLIVTGFMLLSLVEYSLFVPAYWFVFLRKLFRGPPVAPSDHPSA